MKIFKKIGDFFKNLFAKEFKFLKGNSKIAVDVVNLLKGAVESPVATAIVSLIPGNLDNEILYKLRNTLPKIATEMALAHGLIQQASSNAEVMDAIIKHLQSKNVEGRVGFWLELSGRVNMALSDGKLSLPEAVALAQMVYAEIKSK